MENQTAFDLNRAIQRWRENLAQSPALERENLNELESHLRDSITALQTRNLSVEEAFLIATKRIGQSAALEQEFGKVNGSAVWFDRFLWMLLGLQVWAVMGSLSSFASNMLTPLGEQLKSFLGFGSQIVVMDSVRFIITLICSPLLISVVLGFVLWRLTRKKKGVAAFVQKALNRPWTLAGGLFATCVILRSISVLALRYWYIPMFNNTSNGVRWVIAPQVFVYIFEYLILAGLTLLIARKRLRAAAE